MVVKNFIIAKKTFTLVQIKPKISEVKSKII